MRSTPDLVLRTVYLSPSVDDRLSDEARLTGANRSNLIRRYIEAGMKAPGSAAPARAPSAAPAAKKATRTAPFVPKNGFVSKRPPSA